MQSNKNQEVIIMDIKMFFMSIVNFLVEFAIASIPALIFMLLGAVLGILSHGFGM